MVAKPKKAAKGSPSTTPRAVLVGGEPTGRFAEVLAETRRQGLAIEPFEICDGLVLYPPTPERAKKMEQSHAAFLLAQAVSWNLIRTQGEPPSADDPDARKQWAETQQQSLNNANALANEAEQAFNEALYGDADVLQQVEEYFEGRAGWEKEAFANAVNSQFRRFPVDGKCRACGQTVDEEAGESEGESSGGSSISGPSSKGTSPTSSTEPMPATGSEDAAPGSSS